jgi:O-antigen/teichoic acid export membrane protein
MISLAAVTYYTTPYEVISRAAVFPASLVGVLFPAFSFGGTVRNGRTSRLFETGTRYLFIILFPVTLVVLIWAPELLRLWLGAEFALVQGAGRPDITAKLHLVELPLYAIVLWLGIRSAGIDGAAFAWFLRVTLDAVALFAISARLLEKGAHVVLRIAAIVAGGMAILSIAVLTPPTLKITFTGFALAAFLIAAWRTILGGADRAALRRRLRPGLISG